MMQAVLRTRDAGGIVVVYVDGYLNGLLGEEVSRVVRRIVDAGERRVLVNFGGTRLINSRGFSSIVRLAEGVAERQGRLAFCALSPVARDLFRVTGVAGSVKAFDTEGEALAFFGGSG